ncbi:MAG: BatD family protein [Chthoniobacteraceae bacterium]
MTTLPKIKLTALMALIISTFMLGLMSQAEAADPTVTATLSSDNTEVGQPVDLNIQINGSQRAQVPEKIDMDGLTVVHTGQQTQVQMQNFNITSSVVHTYTVQPDRAGKFTIPAITIEVEGKKLTTTPLTLSVSGNSGANGSAGGSGNNGVNSASQAKPEDTNKIAFAELVVPKQSAYVGEIIPIEIRIYFDANVRVQTNGVPEFTSEGFTVQKLTQPRQEQVEKNGHRYNFVSYKTAITPVKSGKLVLGPAELPYVAMVPQRRKVQHPNIGGSMDDFFNDDMFNGMLGGFTQEQLTVKSSSAELEVKPLPKANQPASFSGAVGQFSLTTEASPLKLSIGDPITLKLKISGRGNFDQVSAPRMNEESGWRSYPPSNKFTADDDVETSGSKLFEMAVIPDEKKTKLPAVEFSYFDPITEKYVTLNADRLPITVEGQSASSAPTVQTPSASQPESTPEVVKNANDIHYIFTSHPHWGESFDPIFTKPVFWKSQGAPLLALLAFIGFQAHRKKSRDLIAKQAAERRRQKTDLMKTLQREDADAATFYAAATQYIQIDAAGHSDRNPASITPEEAITIHPLDAATSEAVQFIFAAHEELSYAGDSATRQKLPLPQREKVLQTLKKFENARA